LALNLQYIYKLNAKKLDSENKKIVLIDDDKSTAESISSYLIENGYDVTTAFNGWDGLEAIKRTSPHLIISDIKMPKLGGIELYYILKGLKIHTPVIFISAFEEPKNLNNDLEIFACIPKPINIKELKGFIQQAVQ
jgi:DNA-binding response OmpR family regulator